MMEADGNYNRRIEAKGICASDNEPPSSSPFTPDRPSPKTMIELHCHTTFSDGTLTPTQLVEAALEAGVKALAITDHDTMAGWDEARSAANDRLEIVPGLELSTQHNDRSLHVLGFYPDRQKLQAPLQERIAGRHRRAQSMADRLADLGYPIQLPYPSNGMAPGRPHIAQALLEAGYVTSREEAFQRFLAEGKPVYVPYEKFSTIEGIQLLRNCGAIPVWAHPYLFRGGQVETVLPELVEAGLLGVEVYHPYHSPSQVDTLKQLAQRYNLIITGGTDYHGPSPANPKASASQSRHGYQLNSLQVPLELLTHLKTTWANQSRN